MNEQSHWDAVYAGRTSDSLGWYEPIPSTLAAVLRCSTPDASVVDIGSGDSTLIDHLLEAGYRNVTLVDLSTQALERSRARLEPNPRAEAVRWVHADVVEWDPQTTFDLWHDRAVFHFLVDEEQRDAYVATARRIVRPGGHLIIATFGLGGPDQCAGLPVRRYDAETLAAEFAPAFKMIEHHELVPASTSIGDQRPYIVAVFEARR